MDIAKHHQAKSQVGHKKHQIDAEDPTFFGKEVIHARNKLSWTQEYLAEKSKRSTNTIGNIETGKRPSKETRRVIMEVINTEHVLKFGVPFSWRITDENKILALNKESLLKFIDDSYLVSRIDQDMALIYKVRLVPPHSYIEIILERILHAGITAIPQIEKHLRDKEYTIKQFALACFENPILRRQDLPKGSCIGTLHALLLLENRKEEVLRVFLEEKRHNIQVTADELVKALVGAYNKMPKREVRRKKTADS